VTFAQTAAAFLATALPLAFGAWLFRRLRHEAGTSPALAAVLVLAGGAAGAGCLFVEGVVFRWTELAVDESATSHTSALLTMLLFATPLEEAAKALVVWPAALFRRLETSGRGVLLAALVACGFAAAEGAIFVSGEPSALRVVRALAAAPAQVFAAGVWGSAWGAERALGGRAVASAWLVAVSVRAFYDHIVFGRGPGLLAVAVPLLIAMALVSWSALRDLAPHDASDRGPLSLPEPPSLQSVRRALQRADQPLLLRWIAVGALVNVGMVIVCLGAAVVLARRFGVDLAMADEADVRSSLPILFLGAAVLLAFPIAGYLVARASSSEGVLEPAFAAGVSIAAAVVLLSIAAPSAVIFALAAAPVAFGLACAGAWLGVG
jgi:RsiW-degrading membrane proteinase PrsW (M82 family)